MRIRSLAVGAALLMLGLVPSASTAAEPQDGNYVGIVGDLTLNCTLNLGGSCFDLTGGDVVTVVVADSISDHVGLRLDFRDISGERVGFDRGCDEVTADVPEGAVTLRVAVDGPLGGPEACGESLPEGTAIIGSITVFELWS